MRNAGTAEIRWVSGDLQEIAQRFKIPDVMIKGWLPMQAPAFAAPALREALLAMRADHAARVPSLWPRSALGEWKVSKPRRTSIGNFPKWSVFRPPKVSTSPAAPLALLPQLKGEGILVFDRTALESFDASRAIGPSEETARRDIESRMSYDEAMGSFVAQIAQMRSE